MIEVRESFWTVPETEWTRLWVRVRWHDFQVRDASVGDGDCVNVAELVSRPTDSSFGHRSLTLFAKADCIGPSVVSPLLFDLDLDGDTQTELEDLLNRVRTDLDLRGWSYLVYRSGVGNHVEVDPITVEPYAWGLERGWARQLRDQVRESVDGRGALGGGKACVDLPHDMMRMVGSKHRSGGFKEMVGGTLREP